MNQKASRAISVSKKICKPTAIAAAALTGFLFPAATAVKENSAVINQALGISTTQNIGESDGNVYYYRSSYPSLQQMYQKKVELIRDIAQEGTVLLQNKNETLPMAKGKKLLILNENGLRYGADIMGGSLGFNKGISTLSSAIKGDMEIIEDPSLLQEDDYCLLIIGRAFGESHDASLKDLSLSVAESAFFEDAKNSKAKLIVVLSGDFPIEIGTFLEEERVSSIIKVGNLGFRGSYGLADVLLGNASPSGKLIETYAYSPTSAPSSLNFGDFTYANKNKITANLATKYVIYQEGIYVDYRYYETRYEDAVLGSGQAALGWDYDTEVAFPFGYGLSYTSFSENFVSSPTFDASTDAYLVKVEVENKGQRPGKEVVEIYAQSPYTYYDKQNGIEKSSVTLVGFGKTGTLNSGEKEIVEISIPRYSLASYDAKLAKGYILEKGDYYFSLGNGAHEAVENILAHKGKGVGDSAKAISIDVGVSGDVDATLYKKSSTGYRVTNCFDDADINHFLDESAKIHYLSRSDWSNYVSKQDNLTATSEMVKSLKSKTKYEDGIIDTQSRIEPKTFEMGKENDLKVFDMKGLDYDDPKYEDLLDELTLKTMSRVVANGRFTIPGMGEIGFPEAKGNDNPTGLWNNYIYESIDETTGSGKEAPSDYVLSDGLGGEDVAIGEVKASMFGSEPLLAATWNRELAERQGDFFAEDALYCGVTFVWGMGLNIHRCAYGGRASEYFSADPFLSGAMGCAWNKASNKKGAVIVTKHFAVNEMETNRTGVSTFLNEQSLREIYLRPFETLVSKGEMKGIMTSYNRIGLICTGAEYDLMTEVLRKEWGYQGYAISDLYKLTEGLYDGNAIIAAGTDILLNGSTWDATSGSYATRVLSPERIAEDPALLTRVREACHHLIYVFANSNLINGFSSSVSVIEVTPFYIPLFDTLKFVVLGLAAVGVSAYVTLLIVEQRKEKHHA